MAAAFKCSLGLYLRKMNVEKATLADVPELNSFVNNAYRGENAKQGWTTEADLLDGVRTSEESLAELINRPQAVILLVRESVLQGCVYLEQQGKTLYLGMLTVQPHLQGKGLGAQLMRTSEEMAKELNCNKIKMTVISKRDTLIAYYQRKGFYDTGERVPFPDDIAFGIPKIPLEFIVMEKLIT